METFTSSTATAIINAPIETVDLTEWLFTLHEHEYQACSTGHIACGTTVSEDGKRMSVNVEQVADNLLVQHYVEDIGQKDHCRVQSLSDSISPAGRTRLGIIWELSVKSLSDKTCELTNHVIIQLTDEFREMLHKAGIADLAPVRAGMEINLGAHNKEETPLFAKDIERKALAGVWWD